MKSLSFATLLVFVGVIQAHAQSESIDLINEKVDVLELEQEVEDMEALGDLAIVEENEREAKRLQKETGQLERDIERLKKQSSRATDQKKSLQALYVKREKLARDSKARADRAERIKAKAQANVANLRSRVETKEKEAIQSLERRKSADNEVSRQVRLEKQLRKRLQAANNVVKRNEQKARQVRLKSQRMAKNNRDLERRVLNKERQAIRTASR